MGQIKGKIAFISDKWTLEQLIEVQTRRTNERNRASIERLNELDRELERALTRERKGEYNGR